MLIIRLYIYYICFSWQPEQRVKFGNVRLPPTDQAKKAEYKEGEIVEVMFIQLDSTHRLKVGIDLRDCRGNVHSTHRLKVGIDLRDCRGNVHSTHSFSVFI
jgi:hypothetical protein